MFWIFFSNTELSFTSLLFIKIWHNYYIVRGTKSFLDKKKRELSLILLLYYKRINYYPLI